MRNPVYLGNLAILTGLALMAEVPFLAPGLLLWGFLVYDLSVRFEEVRLLNRFGGEYANYMKTTPRWIPRFDSRNPGGLHPAATWRTAFAVEFHCILLIVFPIAKEVLEWKFGGWRF